MRGDVIRWLTARTIAQQLGKVVEAATAPFQCALSTRAGCECVAHTLQTLCEINPETTVVSVDGISAYDVVSRRAMFEGLRSVHGGAETLPFVRMFYSSPSRYLWEEQEGVVHTIDQGEGGEQGDPVHWRQCSAVSETVNECWHIWTTSMSSHRLIEWGCDCEPPGTVVPPRTHPFARWQDASVEWGWN